MPGNDSNFYGDKIAYRAILFTNLLNRIARDANRSDINKIKIRV